MQVGRCQVFALTDGRFRLDGGAMFGLVPKVLWEKLHPADEYNRIELSLTPMFVISAGKKILIDTGVGSKHGPKTVRNFGMERAGLLLASLKKLGFRAQDVDLVTFSHLHLDHAGGATSKKDGRLAPTFPRAKYLVQRGEWDAAANPNERTRASYLPQDFLPIEEHRQLDLVDGDAEIAPGVFLQITGGHTKSHQVIRVESEGQGAVYLGDLVPTTSHLKPAYGMGYDLYPLELMEVKKRLLARAAEKHWTVFLDHDTQAAAGRMVPEPGGPGWQDVLLQSAVPG